MPNANTWEYAKLTWTAAGGVTFSGPDGVPQDVGGTGRSETRLLTDLGESSWELIAIDRPPGDTPPTCSSDPTAPREADASSAAYLLPLKLQSLLLPAKPH
jgi:hypothetical protein